MELLQLIQSPGALPSIPRVVALVLSELDSDEPDLRKIGMQLKEDPIMTARLLAVANSARFNLSRGVTSVAEALPLLGLDELRDMIYAAAVASAFRQVGGVNMPQFWRYSLNVAKLARRLAMDTPQVSAAYTAGLVHAAGELVLHRALPQQMAELDAAMSVFDLQRAAAEQKLLGYSYAQVGAAFASAWSLPKVLVDVVAYHVDPTVPECREPLAAVVHLASWRARGQEVNLGLEALMASYPDTIASALHLDSRLVLDEKIIDWTSLQEVSGLV
ncbi:MAG: HDOD domain-containing protein [Pseudomonadota bacterium]